MAAKKDVCARCGKPTSEGFTGSLTQWVVLCRCDLLTDENASSSTIEVCMNCGKRIGEGRYGTFTQWIFRADLCNCKKPIPVETTIKSLSNGEFDSSSIDLSAIEEIEVDGNKFPTERFSAIEKLSSTFDSTVYLSVDKLLGTRVAIKSITLNKPEDILRFQKEVKALATLSHPGIVGVLDFAENNGAPYMVMEYIDGVTLRQVLRENSHLSVEDTVHVILSLSRALAYCHSKNVLHRDIKPENILVLSDQKPFAIKLVDFGLASTHDALSSQGETIAGTPLYMAPDAGKGSSYDVRSEIYSLGCVLFELLTGEVPFEADSPLQLLKLHAEAEIPSLSSKSNGMEFDHSLEEIVARCLSKEPDDRFQTMEELESSLKELYSPEDLRTISKEKDEEVSEASLDNRKTIKTLALPVVIIILCCGFVGFYINLLNSKDKLDFEAQSETNQVVKSKNRVDQNSKSSVMTKDGSGDSGELGDDYLHKLSANPSTHMKGFVFSDGRLMSALRMKGLFAAVKLKDVSFEGKACRAKYVKNLAYNQELETLRLQNPAPKVLKAIPGNMKKLHAFVFTKSRVSSKQVRLLKRLSKLIEIEFDRSQIEDGALAELARLPVKILRFKYCSMSLRDLEELKFRRFETIHLYACSFSGDASNYSKEYATEEGSILSGLMDVSTGKVLTAPAGLLNTARSLNADLLKFENYDFRKTSILRLSKAESVNRIAFYKCYLEDSQINALRKALPDIEVTTEFCGF